MRFLSYITESKKEGRFFVDQKGIDRRLDLFVSNMIFTCRNFPKKAENFFRVNVRNWLLRDNENGVYILNESELRGFFTFQSDNSYLSWEETFEIFKKGTKIYRLRKELYDISVLRHIQDWLKDVYSQLPYGINDEIDIKNNPELKSLQERIIDKLHKMSVPDLSNKIDEWYTIKNKILSKNIRTGADEVEEIMKLKSGWRWVEMLTDIALEYEGSKMNHCISGYHMSKTYFFWSLRDKSNIPHVTIELEKNSTNNYDVRQVKGKKNSTPDKYVDQILALLNNKKYTFNDKWFEQDQSESDLTNLNLVKANDKSWIVYDA